MKVNIIWCFFEGEGPSIVEEGDEGRRTYVVAYIPLSVENSTATVIFVVQCHALPCKCTVDRIQKGVGQ